MNEPSSAPQATASEPSTAPSQSADVGLSDVTASPASADTDQPSAEPPKAVEDPKFVARFKELSKRDKQARERELALKGKEEMLANYGQAERLAKEDPLKLMELLGITYEEVTDRVLKGARKDPQLSAVEREILELKRQISDERSAAQRQAEDRAVADAKRSIRQLVDSDPDAYELVRERDAYELVWSTIEDQWNDEELSKPEAERRVMPYEEAAALTERYLLAEATGYAKAKKVRALIAPPPNAQAGDSGAQRPSEGGQRERPDVAARLGHQQPPRVTPSVPVTLTNGVASSANPSPQSMQKSRDDARERAIAALTRARTPTR